MVYWLLKVVYIYEVLFARTAPGWSNLSNEVRDFFPGLSREPPPGGVSVNYDDDAD